MSGSNLIKEARRRSGLTQKQLAERLNTHQPVIARWETGRSRPDYDTVANVLSVCGFHLSVYMTPADDHDAALIERELRLDPHERLKRMVLAVNAFDAMTQAATSRV